MSKLTTLKNFLAEYVEKTTTVDEYLMVFSLGLDTIYGVIKGKLGSLGITEREELSEYLDNVGIFNINNGIVHKMYFLPIKSYWGTLPLFQYGWIQMDKPIENKEAFMNLIKACKMHFPESAKIIFKNKASLKSVLETVDLAELDIDFERSFPRQ